MNDILRIRLQEFEKLPGEIEIFTQELMKDGTVNDKFTELNREQMYAGKRSDDTNIEPDYKPFTVRTKSAKGQPTDRVTLDDTGDHYRSLRTKVTPGKTELYSTDWKTDQLQAKYNTGSNSQIYGLSEESIAVMRDFLRPDLVSFTHNYFKADA